MGCKETNSHLLEPKAKMPEIKITTKNNTTINASASYNGTNVRLHNVLFHLNNYKI